MSRIIKMDFYRLFRNKMTYILLGASVLFSAFMLLTYGFLELSVKVLDTEELGAETVALIEATLPQNLEGYFTMFISGNLIIVFVLLFAILFCSAEYKTGYIKNTAVNILPRYLTYFSKLIVVSIYCVAIFAIVLLVLFGGCAIMGHVGFEDPDALPRAIAVIVAQILCNISLTSFFMMLYYVTRSTSLTMISGLVYSTMGTLLYSLVNLLLSVAFPSKNVDSTKFTNLGNMIYHLHINNTGDDFRNNIIRSIIVSIVFLALSSFLSCVAINKKDIK